MHMTAIQKQWADSQHAEPSICVNFSRLVTFPGIEPWTVHAPEQALRVQSKSWVDTEQASCFQLPSWHLPYFYRTEYFTTFDIKEDQKEKSFLPSPGAKLLNPVPDRCCLQRGLDISHQSSVFPWSSLEGEARTGTVLASGTLSSQCPHYPYINPCQAGATHTMPSRWSLSHSPLVRNPMKP